MSELAIRTSLGHLDDCNDSMATFTRELGLSSAQLQTPTNPAAVDKLLRDPDACKTHR
jgi:hypothetical protein